MKRLRTKFHADTMNVFKISSEKSKKINFRSQIFRSTVFFI